MSTSLYYNTPIKQLRTHYGLIQAPFTQEKISTQLPKNIAVIRVIAALAFTALLAFKLSGTLFYWPVVIIGLGFSGWTIYSHLLAKDPMMEAFYKIVGGKEKFEQLPEIQLPQTPGQKICRAAATLNWEQLEHPISKARTLDGRNIVIVKGMTRYLENSFKTAQVKGTLIFVEKVSPQDVRRQITKLPKFFDSVKHALSMRGNTLCCPLYSSEMRNTDENYSVQIYSSISKNMANEFFAQCR